MSDYRYHPLTDQWVLMAGNRQGRPSEFCQQQTHLETRPCPFCLGHESETPDAVKIYPTYPEQTAWSVRVFPNKYPALTETQSGPVKQFGPYASFVGFGIHELIVLSPRHVESFGALTTLERELSLFAFQERLRTAYRNEEIRHAVVFQNCRVDAGASIQHVHCQLIGTSVTPPEIRRRAERQQRYYEQHGHSLLEAIVKFELEAETRLIDQSNDWVEFCPYASGMPYQTWLTPRFPDSQPDFLSLDRSQLNELAKRLQHSISRLESTLSSPAYNFVVHLPPDDDAPQDMPRPWYIEVMPRINKTAGFEWATDCLINQVPPENAARHLRDN